MKGVPLPPGALLGDRCRPEVDAVSMDWGICRTLFSAPNLPVPVAALMPGGMETSNKEPDKQT